MIKFYNQHNVPESYARILREIKNIKNAPISEDEIYLVCTMSEPSAHQARIRAWLDERLTEYPAYWGNLISVAIVTKDVASILKLSLPLT